MSAPGSGERPAMTTEGTLNKALLTLLSIAELRQGKNKKEDMIPLATEVKFDPRDSPFTVQCSFSRAPCPPLLYMANSLAGWRVGDFLTKYDGRSFDTDHEWGRVIAAMVLTYEALAKSLTTVWNDRACCQVLNTFIQNYLCASGWNPEAKFRQISLDKFREYYLNFSHRNTTGNFHGYFCRFANPKQTAKYEDYEATARPKIIFGLPEESDADSNSAFLYTMRRASLFCYFLLNCPTGSLIKQGEVAPASNWKVQTMNPTKAHDKFEQIYTQGKKLSAARLIAELAAHTCENFLRDKVNLRVVTYANGQLEEEEEEGGEAKQRPGTTGTPGPSSERSSVFHESLDSFPAGCDLSQAVITSCQASCALSLFAATPATGSPVDRHYAADFLFKILKPGPAYELCVYSACTQAALFASTQPSTAPSDMFKVMYTPLDVTTQVKRMHSSCAGTDTWNGRHPLTRLPGGAGAYSALCLAHPTIAASASYATFEKAHPEVARAWLTTEELFASYRVGLLVCYALPALGERRGLLQTAVSTAACLVAPKNAGAAVHAVFNHCQYWLPMPDQSSLVAAAELPNDRHLLLLSDHHDKFSVQNVSTDEYNSRTGGWAQWYRQRLLFDLSCWVEGADSASIQADTRQLDKAAIDTEQKSALSSSGRTAFARWSLPGQAS